MKKLLAIFLAALLLLSLSGCDQEKALLFYYPRTQIQYGASDGVIASEVREASGHENDLTYLLKLYLEGPISQELKSPFPMGTTLHSVDDTDGNLHIVLSEQFSQLENLEHTIACACIASTCFSLTDAQTVTISTTLPDGQVITLARDSIALVDNSATESN